MKSFSSFIRQKTGCPLSPLLFNIRSPDQNKQAKKISKRLETGNWKGKRRKSARGYEKSINYKFSDLRKTVAMDIAEKDFENSSLNR